MTENDFPKDLFYDKGNSWVKVDGNVASIGLNAKAAKKVKEFVFIMLPEKGKKIKKGESYISLEAVKWSGHLSSPVSGEIIDVNESLFDEPSKINNDPYGSWIMKVEMESSSEIKSLMNAKEASENL